MSFISNYTGYALRYFSSTLKDTILPQITTQQKTICMISTIVIFIFAAKQFAYGSYFSNDSPLKKREGNISIVSV